MSAFRIERFEDRYQRSYGWLVERVRDRPERYARAGTSAFSGIDLEVLGMTFARGAEIGRTLAPIAPLLEDGLAKVGTRAADGPIGLIELCTLDILGVIGGSGVAMSDASFAAARAIVSAIATTRRTNPVSWHWQRGFIALALDVPAVYRGIAGFELHEPIPFTPGATFGPNIQGCLAHFAGAVESGAALDACLPAWADLAAYSESLGQAMMFTTSIFLWGAWILRHRIDRQPIATVTDWLHESLYRLAGAGA